MIYPSRGIICLVLNVTEVIWIGLMFVGTRYVCPARYVRTAQYVHNFIFLNDTICLHSTICSWAFFPKLCRFFEQIGHIVLLTYRARRTYRAPPPLMLHGPQHWGTGPGNPCCRKPAFYVLHVNVLFNAWMVNMDTGAKQAVLALDLHGNMREMDTRVSAIHAQCG